LDLLEPFVLALDGISDPGNMGTIIRLADWYGLTQILASEDCVYVNYAKWGAAQKWCARQGLTFRVITENDMFSNGRN